MTPKEKARELVLKYLRVDNNTKEWFHTGIAKQCALIAVDEIIANIEPSVSMDVIESRIKYWQEVKQEISNI